MKNNNPYKYLGFVLIVMLMGKFIFFSDSIHWLFGALKPIILVLIIIYMINPLVTLLENKTKLKRTGSVLIAFLICFLFITGFISLILPSIIDSSRIVISNIPSNNKQFLVLIEKLPIISYFIDTTSLSTFLDALGQWVTSFSKNLIQYSDEVINSVKNFVTTLSLVFLSILMAFYALKGNSRIASSLEETLRAFIPDSVINQALKVIRLLDAAFKKFLIGKLYTCVILGIIVTFMILIFNLIGPWGIKIPYAPLIGFIIGITNIIPYVGPLIGTIPCLFLAMLSGFGEVVFLLLIVLVAQQIDNIFISPKILGDTIGLDPFWIILSVTVGGILFGAIGMVLFVPLTSVLLKLITDKVKIHREAP